MISRAFSYIVWINLNKTSQVFPPKVQHGLADHQEDKLKYLAPSLDINLFFYMV